VASYGVIDLKSFYYYDTFLGRIEITENGEAITSLRFSDRKNALRKPDLKVTETQYVVQHVAAQYDAARQTAAQQQTEVQLAAVCHQEAGKAEIRYDTAVLRETPLLKRAGKQLMEYLAGERKEFDLPLALEGTEFQQAVWKALLSIPYGQTRSYSQIAASIGNPKACRAVGMANNRNPVAIIVPCHRVIGADGRLVGYGSGLDIKEKLLNLEKRFR